MPSPQPPQQPSIVKRPEPASSRVGPARVAKSSRKESLQNLPSDLGKLVENAVTALAASSSWESFVGSQRHKSDLSDNV